MASPVGSVLNSSASLARITAIVKSGNAIAVGLVYEDGSNGWKNAPTDSSKLAKDLYWCPDSFASQSVDKKITVYDLDGLEVVGKADGTLVLDTEVKASTTSGHGGQLITNPEPTSAFTAADAGTVDGTYGAAEAAVIEANRTRIAELVTREAAIRTWVKHTVGHYIGHEAEIREGTTRTNAADAETTCVFVLRRGK
jgi:hypothetical protein